MSHSLISQLHACNQKFSSRIYILYDGIHYDACERGQGTSIFRCNDNSDVHNEVALVLMDLKEKKQYTNTKTFGVVCQECFVEMDGEKDMQIHAQKTGHINFVQKE